MGSLFHGSLRSPVSTDPAATLRVLYDHQAFSLQAHGGITRYYRELARYMAQQAVQTHVELGLTQDRLHLADIKGIRLLALRSAVPAGRLRYALNEGLT